MKPAPRFVLRRRVLGTSLAAVAAAWSVPLRAGDAQEELPDIPELTAWLAGRAPRYGRLMLDVPRLADNGNAVPLRLAMTGPFAPGTELRALRLYSERNPVPLMARFEFPAPPPRVEIDSRIRLAGTQTIVAVAEMGNGEIHAAAAKVEVTVSACLDGS